MSPCQPLMVSLNEMLVGIISSERSESEYVEGHS